MAAGYIQEAEAEEHDRESHDEDQRDDSQCHDGGEHSSCSEEEDDGDTLDETVSLTEASSTAMTMVSSSPCESRQSSTTRSCSRVDDIASTPASSPVQLIIIYRATIFSGKARSFSQAWYNAYPWLEYSAQANVCFCYSCHLFGSEPGSNFNRSFTKFLVGGGACPQTP